MDEGLKDPGVNPVIIHNSLGLNLITNIQLLIAAHSSSATSAHISIDIFSVDSANTSKEKLSVKPASLARRSKRLEEVHRQYVVAELFPSISDTEDGDDGVEFC